MNSVSQSAASQQVQEMERVFGVTLLDRSRRPLVVTEAGQLYAEFCREALRSKEEFEDSLARLRKPAGGTVRVASIYSVGMSELVELERKFCQEHPGAEVEVQYLQPQKVYLAVLGGEADIGLVSYPVPNRQLKVRPWRREEMVVAAAPGHALAKRAAERRGPLPVMDLNGASFIGFDEELPIRHHVDRFLNDHQIDVDLVLHFDNIEMVKEAVAHGVGVAILPHRSMREDIRQKRLTAIRIAGEALYRPLAIIHRKNRRLPQLEQAFLAMLMETPVPASVEATPPR